jgi:hypothetical protein
VLHASYASAWNPAIIIGKDNRKAGAVLAPNQNIENNPMQSNTVSLAWTHRDGGRGLSQKAINRRFFATSQRKHAAKRKAASQEL